MAIALLLMILAGISVMLAVLFGAIYRFKTPAPYQGSYPGVSVIRPVKGRDVDALNNFRSALIMDYPGEVETLFVFEDEHDPAFALAEAAISELPPDHRHKARLILSGAPKGDCTGKLHNMLAGEKEARYDLIAFSDSDTRPKPEILRVLVETLLSCPGAGSSFLTAISDQPMSKVGDAFYAMLQNVLYAPFALSAAGARNELPFIMGQYMLFKRESLHAIGGVACAKGQLVDDMYLGKKLLEAGYLNVIAPLQLSIFSQGITFRDFIPIYRKWFQFGRNGLPATFLWRHWVFSALFFASVAFLIMGIGSQNWPVIGLSLLNITIFSGGLLLMHRALGGSPFPIRYYWVAPSILLISLGIMLSNRLHRKVNWRGHVYELNRKAALDDRSSSPQTVSSSS